METASKFLCLPRELRDEIFDFALDDGKQERTGFTREHDTTEQIRPPLGDLPPLCSVSQQFYLEATPRYLNRATLSSSDATNTSWLIKWLAAFPGESGYRAVQHVAFRNFHDLEQLLGYQLLSSCYNIRSLNIMFGDEFSNTGMLSSLSMMGYSGAMNAYESIDNFMLKYQLHRLLELPKLETLDFGFHDWVQPVSTERARYMKDWLTEEFRARGRYVKIECRQMQWGTLRGDNYLVAMFGRWNSTN